MMCRQACKELKLSEINSTAGLIGGTINKPMAVGALELTYKSLSVHLHLPIVQSTHLGMKMELETIKKFMQILVLSHLIRVDYGMPWVNTNPVQRHTHPVLHLRIIRLYQRV